MYPLYKCLPSRFSTILLLPFIFMLSCDGGTFEVPAPEEFTKKNREKLGELLQNAISENNLYQILPNHPPYDTTVYWYIRELYNQATLSMRLDNLSPSNDRWNQNRDWNIQVVLDENSAFAFTLPGGDFYISTGFLKLFEEDFELYYVLSFESLLMNEGNLLTRLIEEYNSLTLVNIIQGKATANNISAKIIAEELPELTYETSLVRDLDSKTVKEICKTSVFERQGIILLLNEYNEFQVDWLRTRETYETRAQDIPFYSTEAGLVCGDIRNTGKYKQYVLDFLP